MGTRAVKFLSFYRPYIGTLAFDLLCAFFVSAITLVLPLCCPAYYAKPAGHRYAKQLRDIGVMALIMLALVAAHTLCNLFVDYQGH